MHKRDFTDHQLAEYLRNKGVINNWVSIESPSINEYWNGAVLVAIVVFDNVNMNRVVYTRDMD